MTPEEKAKVCDELLDWIEPDACRETVEAIEHFRYTVLNPDCDKTPPHVFDFLLYRGSTVQEFVRAAVLAEREECAKVADEQRAPHQMLERYTDEWARGVIWAADNIAAAIRGRE